MLIYGWCKAHRFYCLLQVDSIVWTKLALDRFSGIYIQMLENVRANAANTYVCICNFFTPIFSLLENGSF